MKLKHGVILLIVGFIVSCIGALAKIMHWPMANAVLICSTIFQVIGLIIILIKLIAHPKIKAFLNT